MKKKLQQGHVVNPDNTAQTKEVKRRNRESHAFAVGFEASSIEMGVGDTLEN